MERLTMKTKEITDERFGKDTIIALATVKDRKPIEENPHVAISGDWFTAHGINTCILCIRLTEGVLFSHGTKYDIDFSDISCHTNKETLSN